MSLLKPRAIVLDAGEEAASAHIESVDRWSSQKDRKLDAACCALLTVIILAVFYKTVFLGLPISRIGLIAEWDSLFAALRQGSSLHIDPSAVLLALPTYTSIAGQYHAGMVPLWNNLNAFGSPLVGDIQATVFSPLRLLFNLLPNMQTYNLQLVLQVEIAALGTYFLCRQLQVIRAASVLAAVSYAFCPFVLWYLELQSGVGFVFNPMILWLFARAANLRTPRAALLAGLGSGITILIGHPETSFFAILFGSLVLFVMMAPHFIQAFKSLALAGAAAFCTCAPSFLPFIEFAKNSDCYKYGVTESAFMPWQAVLFNLSNPVAAGASPYLGGLAAALVLLSYSSCRRREFWAMFSVAVPCIILAAKLFPFSLVANVAPFNYLITVYAVPLYLVALTALAGLGLTNLAYWLTSENKQAKRIAAIAFIAAVSSATLLAFLWELSSAGWTQANFDMTLPESLFQQKVWIRDAVMAAVAVGLALAAIYRQKAVVLLVVALAALNSVGVIASASRALPVQPKFELPQIEAMHFLRQAGQRSLAVGTHLAKPDVNLLYGVDDVRSINAMLPPRYVSFIRECGATTDQFTQWFGEKLSRTIDLGSVKYILSQTPVASFADIPEHGLILDTSNRQVIGHVRIPVEHPCTGAICLADGAGAVIWFGDRFQMAGASAQFISVPLPPDSDWKGYSLKAQTFDDKGLPARTIELGELSGIPASSSPARLRLAREFEGNVRLYENTTALDRAYFVPALVVASDAEDVLRKLRSPEFDPRRQAVVDGPGAESLGSNTLQKQSGITWARVEIISRRPDQVKIRYSSDAAGAVVLTDTFYPGWKADIDGQQAPILRANYMFRAVSVPAGTHVVTFSYLPETFRVGVILFVSFWGTAILIASGLLRRLFGKDSAQRETRAGSAGEDI